MFVADRHTLLLSLTLIISMIKVKEGNNRWWCSQVENTKFTLNPLEATLPQTVRLVDKKRKWIALSVWAAYPFACRMFAFFLLGKYLQNVPYKWQMFTHMIVQEYKLNVWCRWWCSWSDVDRFSESIVNSFYRDTFCYCSSWRTFNRWAWYRK